MTMSDIQVFLPGDSVPVTNDYYADYMMSVAACGSYEQSLSVPGYFDYTNPVSGKKISFGSIPRIDTRST